MTVLPRYLPTVLVLAVCAVAAGCARGTTASIPPAPIQAPQGADMPAEETPEPLAPGLKPLTVEQEEAISQ